MADEVMDASKSECLLSINSFDEPTKISGVDAWVKLITDLIFMPKGTYPSDPDMGCDFDQYDFGFIDEVLDDIQENITSQVQKYLPDIPLTSVIAQKDEAINGEPILLVILQFTVDDIPQIVVVAAEKSDSIINFEVAL